MKLPTYHTMLLVLGVGAVLAAGCKKDFINDPKPTAAVPVGDAFKSVAGVRSYFNGIYRNMRSQWANLDQTAGNSTDAWGYSSINTARINKGIDMINPGGWYQFDYRQENREPTYRRTIFTWGFFYEFINQFNVIIDGVTRTTSIPAEDKTPLLAEARALRAWFYFELIREFQHPVTRDANAPGVPLYTEPTSIDIVGKPRGTITDVYNLINTDIAFATANLGTSRLERSDVNVNVAWGMAARIYLEQRRWADARDAAQKARNGYPLDRDSYADGYNNLKSPELIWGFPQATDIGGQSLYYGTPSSFYEKTGNGYDNLFVSSALVDAFTASDVRYTFYTVSTNPASSQRYGTNKFGIASQDDIELHNGEVVKLKETDFNEVLPMMRSAEMYLIEAEAKAELGQADAGTILHTLQNNRDPLNTTASGNTGQALIDEILLERRKELYGELGIDWLDIKRRQLPLVRLPNHPAAYRFNFPANDNRLIMKIPQKEFDSNTALNPATDQNP